MLHESKLLSVIPASCVTETLEARLKRLINQSHVMIFMKGSPSQAACGFSQRLVNLLSQYDGLDYGHFDIFKDEEVREGLKKYSKWPTYPQVYVDG
jgi:glutaredoxin-related protein